MKKLTILFIMLACSFLIYAEKIEITNGSRVWQTSDCVNFKPLFSLSLERPDLGTTLVKELATESIDTYNNFICCTQRQVIMALIIISIYATI